MTTLGVCLHTCLLLQLCPQHSMRRRTLRKGTTVNRNDLLARQEQYCAEADDSTLIDGHLFIESIRKLGYRNFSAAVHELADNAVEALAENFHIYLETENPKDTKVSAVAFVDDGVGMIPGMLQRAVKWGGTDRHGSRELFGCFGFGLPSASISQGRRYTVYSRTDGGDFSAITIDVDELGKAGVNADKLPTPANDKLPKWVTEAIKKDFPGGLDSARTVVIWEKLDHKQWRTITDLERNLLWRLGVTYRGFLRGTRMRVNGKTVDPVDPLFTSADGRYYEPLPDGAEPRPGTTIDVKDEDGKVIGSIRVRYAYIPFDFLDDSRGRKGGNPVPAKARFEIRKENNGLIFTRNGRQVDVLQRSEVANFQNNDRYIGVEIDFDATLDELFGITTSKQSVTLTERANQALLSAGVKTAISAMQRQYKEEASARKAARVDEQGDDDTPRASEQIMEEISTIIRKRGLSTDQQEAAEDNLVKQVKRKSKQTGISEDVVKEELDRQTLERPYKIERERSPEAPFYRVELRGAQLVIWLNTAHRFYTDVYAVLDGPEGARVRAGLELLLFVLGSCEVEATSDGRIWYSSERVDWSRKLTAALTKLEEMIVKLGAEVVEEPSGDELEATESK